LSFIKEILLLPGEEEVSQSSSPSPRSTPLLPRFCCNTILEHIFALQRSGEQKAHCSYVLQSLGQGCHTFGCVLSILFLKDIKECVNVQP